MRFSIITITYNSERYLEETIKSVLSQDCADFEYIIVDGGSTDGTLEIIQRYAGADERIRWISGPDEGISDAFNKGLALASGEIIGIINSDDTYLPGTLAAVAEAYRFHPDCDVFHGDMLRMQGDRVLFLLKPSDPERTIWRGMPVNHPATFITKRAYEKIGGYDPELKIAMDYDLVLRLHLNGCRFHYLEVTLARMRYGGESDEKFLAGRREVLLVSIRAGYPRWKAYCWFSWNIVKNIVKGMLRKLGLYGLLRLHPRISSHKGDA